MTLYETLGVEATATTAEIQVAYRRLARLYHPDRNPDPNALEQFKDIQQAWEVLRDAVKRNTYDASGEIAPPQLVFEAESYLIHQTLAWVLDTRNDHNYSNLITHLDALLTQQLEAQGQAILEGDAVKGRLTRALAKLKCTSERDFLRIALEERRESAQAIQDKIRVGFAALKLAQVLVKDYDYDAILQLTGVNRPHTGLVVVNTPPWNI